MNTMYVVFVVVQMAVAMYRVLFFLPWCLSLEMIGTQGNVKKRGAGEKVCTRRRAKFDFISLEQKTWRQAMPATY